MHFSSPEKRIWFVTGAYALWSVSRHQSAFDFWLRFVMIHERVRKTRSQALIMHLVVLQALFCRALSRLLWYLQSKIIENNRKPIGVWYLQ